MTTLYALAMTIITWSTTDQIWEYDYNGNIYAVECDAAHLNEASFIDIDGNVVYIADLD